MNIAKVQTDQARWYHPSTGRFLSEDPIGFGGGDTNFYRYVKNNALKYIDSTGLNVNYSNSCNMGLGLSIEMQILLEEIDNAYPNRDVNVTSCVRSTGKQKTLMDAGLTSSGYGSPYKNISQHVRGNAADISISGVSTQNIANTARRLGATGTIPYDRGFTHVDKRNGQYHPRDANSTCP